MSQESGRANQRARTRGAIVEAAQALRADGSVPTVAEAADSAGVSRATAYRYFPTQEALLVELDARSINARIGDAIDGFVSDDVERSLLALIEAYGELASREEVHMRTALRVYQDTWLRGRREGAAPPVRRGQRMEWLDKILAPLPSMRPEAMRRLRAALALTLGADSLVILKDVAHLEHDEANEVLKWAAATLLRAALSEPDT